MFHKIQRKTTESVIVEIVHYSVEHGGFPIFWTTPKILESFSFLWAQIMYCLILGLV